MVLVHVVPALRIFNRLHRERHFRAAANGAFIPKPCPKSAACDRDGPVSITAEFQFDPARRDECVDLMREARLIFLRNGAYRWHLYEDLEQPNTFRMEVVMSSRKQYLLGVERLTKNEKDVIDKLRGMHIGSNPPDTWISLCG